MKPNGKQVIYKHRFYSRNDLLLLVSVSCLLLPSRELIDCCLSMGSTYRFALFLFSSLLLIYSARHEIKRVAIRLGNIGQRSPVIHQFHGQSRSPLSKATETTDACRSTSVPVPSLPYNRQRDQPPVHAFVPSNEHESRSTSNLVQHR
jgi:hypothetical protein